MPGVQGMAAAKATVVAPGTLVFKHCMRDDASLIDMNMVHPLASNLFFELDWGLIEKIFLLGNGTFNFAIFIKGDATTSGKNFVLRVPRKQSQGVPNTKIRDQAVFLNHLRLKDIPVVPVFAYNCSSQNGLGCEFLIQGLAGGKTMCNVWDNLSVEQKLPIVEDFAQFLGKLEKVKFDKAGYIESSSRIPRKLCSNGRVPVHCPEFDSNQMRIRPFKPMANTFQGSLADFIEARLRHRMQDDGRAYAYYWFTLYEVFLELKMMGFLEHSMNTCAVKHWDLYQRNMNVSRDDEGVYHLNAILDWDDATSLPRALRMRPHNWIWNKAGRNEQKERTYDIPSESPAPHYPQLKARFDHLMESYIPGYYDLTYGNASWVRRLWSFAQHGIRSEKYAEMILQLACEWKEKLLEMNKLVRTQYKIWFDKAMKWVPKTSKYRKRFEALMQRIPEKRVEEKA